MSESHQHTVDSRYENVPTDHLDRAWPVTGRNASEQVAARRAGPSSGDDACELVDHGYQLA